MDENKGFDFGAMMEKALGSQAAAPGLMQIRYVPYELLVPNPTNDYSMDGLEELAGNIETVGLLDPPLVRPIEDGKFMLVSGHRRHAAIGRIIQGGSNMFAQGVPCIVGETPADAKIAGLINELRLLLANADNRKMTSADENQQAERTERVVAALAEAGFEFPGRRRDWVAKLSGLNKTKLGNLKVIREKLAPEIKKKYYDKGKMPESVALALARQDVELQREIVKHYTQKGSNLEYMREWYVTEYVGHVKRLSKYKCPKEKGAACSHQAGLLARIYDGSDDYKACEYNRKCCADCDKLAKCKFVCPKLAAKAKQLKEQAKAEAAGERARMKAEAAADVREIEHIWFRFGQALAVNGVKDKTLRSQDGFKLYMSDERIEALEDYSCTDTSKNEHLPFNYNFDLTDFRRLRSLADKLGVSLDYLFLRTDAPEIGSAASAPEASELPPKPGEWVTGHGRQLSFDEIAERVGKVIVYDQSTQSKEAFKAVKVEKIVEGEFGRRLVYFDGRKQRGYVNESYFDETLPHPCRAYELAPKTGERIAAAPEAPRNDRTWQTGEPTEAGYYAVKKQLFKTDFVSTDAYYWDGGWFNSHLPGASPIDEAYTILRWVPLPEEDEEEKA